MTIPRPLTAALALAGAVALAGCAAPPSEPGYAIDVYYEDLQVGSCIESAWNGDTRTEPFDFDALTFRVVDCTAPHVAQVLGRVEIPAADEWAFYGTTDGPSRSEADAWLEGVCRSFEVLATHYLGRPSAVEPVYAVLGDAHLGFCLLNDLAVGGLTDVVDVDAMLRSAHGLGFDAGVPDVPGWLAPAVDGTIVYWSDIQPGDCVDPYSGPDQEEYVVVDCAGPHSAVVLAWVPMPPDWNGVHPGTVAAQAHSDAACAALRTDPAAVVEASDASEEYVVDDAFIAICWQLAS